MLDPIKPEDAVELYLTDKTTESAEQTVRSHRSRLGFFLKWCVKEEIDNMNDLSGRDLHDFRVWRRTAGRNGEDGISKATEKSQMNTLSVFIRWCESIDAVSPNLHEKILAPSLSKQEGVRDEMLDEEVAESILDYQNTYNYASFDHVQMILIWRCLLRTGGIRAIDIDDCELDCDEPYIKIRHRPKSDTPLKKQQEGERIVGIKPEVAETINDYIKTNRHDLSNDGSRKPLLTTTQGRPHRQTIQAASYAVTRPCVVTDECPHDRNINQCRAAKNRQQAFRCPSSKSPHAVRRGAITAWLNNDAPEAFIAERASTDIGTLSKYYDRRTELEKMQQRREWINNV